MMDVTVERYAEGGFDACLERMTEGRKGHTDTDDSDPKAGDMREAGAKPDKEGLRGLLAVQCSSRRLS